MQHDSFFSGEPSMTEAQTEGLPFEVKGLLVKFLRRSPWILLLAIICGLGATYYARRIPHTFTATAVIEIDSSEPKPLAFTGDSETDVKDPDVRETIVRKLMHRSLMTRVAKKLDLMDDAAFLGHQDHLPVSLDSAIAILMTQSKSEFQTGTRLIDVSFSHADPIVAQTVANGIVTEFLEQEGDDRLSSLRAQNKILKATAENLRNQVLLSEQKMQAYKEEKGSVSLEERYNFVEKKLASLNSDLNGAKTERIGIESDRASSRAAGTDPQKLLTIPSVAKDPLVKEALEKWNASRTELSALAERYRSKYPRMIEAQAQVETFRQSLLTAIAGAPNRIEALYQVAQGKEERLQRAVSEQEAALLNLENVMIPYRALEREYESNRTLYAQVLQKMNESTISLGAIPTTFRLTDLASPGKALPNRAKLYVFGASAAGALFAAAIIIAVYLLDQSIKTVDEAERVLGLPVLADVAISKRVRNPKSALSLLDRPASSIAESFRTLRTSLSLLEPTRHKILLFTSAVSGEGKSFTVANTAVAFAQQGLRTLVVDADLRCPTSHKLLRPGEPPAAGLAEYLLDQSLEISTTEVPHLDILTAGKSAQRPAELLGLPRYRDLLESLRNSYDKILIDTAPINLVSDTLNIAPFADIVCLVVRGHSTPRKVVARSLRLLGRINIRPFGIVLSQMPPSTGFHYYHSYSAVSQYGTHGTYSVETARRSKGPMKPTFTTPVAADAARQSLNGA